MHSFKYYNKTQPLEKTYVNFIFTSRSEHCLSCLLIDYNIDAIMPFKLLTRKKKIKSLNKLTLLNKPMIGWIEEINSTDFIISLAYVDTKSNKYLEFIKLNEKNNILKNIFTRYCYKNNLILEDYWSLIMDPIDNIRDSVSLYDYFVTNLNSINLNSNFIFFINECLKEKENMLITKFKLISNTGVTELKQIFSNSLTKTSLNCNIKLDNCPNYKLISNNLDITKEDHQRFFDILKENKKIILSCN